MSTRASRAPGHIKTHRDPLSILILCDDRRAQAPNVLEHIRALRHLSRHRVDLFNPRGARYSRRLRLDDYDVVVVHYTIFVLFDTYLPPWVREQLASFNRLKAQFIQDEYRDVDAVTARIGELGVNVLFSSIPPDVASLVYGHRLPGVEVLPTLTGYVPAELEGHHPRPLRERPLDVVYRGRSVPYWLGRLGQEKVLIGREFLAQASSTDLRCDIAWTEAERIYGEDWYRFLSSGRTTLGTESGASIVDFDGSLQERTDEYLAVHPDATFDEVEREILAPFEGNAIIEAVSPRVFEAAALGTAMVNFTGRYSDVIEPWVHYVPLEKDFSNFGDVVAAIRDEALLDRVASRAHADLVASRRYSLQRFVQDFEREIEARVRPVERRPRSRLARAANHRLLALEQLRTPARRADLPLVARLRTQAVQRAGRRLIHRFPEIEALTSAARGDGSERLLHDLVRLAAAAAAHVRELRYYGPPFDVRLELDDKGRRLVLVSTLEPDVSERVQLRDPVASAIREERLEEVLWNHSAVGSSLSFVVVPPASLEIGYHVVKGAHRFTALTELGHSDPEGLIRALEPLFRPRPDAAVHELQGPLSSLPRLLSAPGPVAARGAAALRAALTGTELRRLLRAYLRSSDARAEAPLDLLLEDLFKLSLVAQTRVEMELDPDRKSLVYRTNGTPGARRGIVLDAAVVGSLEQIVWDNSSAGSSVISSVRPRVSVTLEAGRHEFEALTLVARRFPALAAPALLHAAAPDERSST
jgi:hypothetical protein